MGLRESKDSAMLPGSGTFPFPKNTDIPRGSKSSTVADDMPTSRAVPVLRGPLPDFININIIWPEDSSQPAVQIRRAIALHLASSPDSRLGPLRVQLPNLSWHLRRNYPDLWLNPAHKWPKLKVLLLDDGSRNAFLCQRDEEGRDVVVLNATALQAMAAAAAAPPAVVDRDPMIPKPAAQRGDGGAGAGPLPTMSGEPSVPSAAAAAAAAPPAVSLSSPPQLPSPLPARQRPSAPRAARAAPQPSASPPTQSNVHGPVKSSALPPAATSGRGRPTGRSAAAAAASVTAAASAPTAAPTITIAATAAPSLDQDEKFNADLQLLVRHALVADPRFNEQHVRLLRVTAVWLATSPQPSLGSYSATLTNIRTFLMKEHAGFWYGTDSWRPPLGELLKSPAARGIFQVGGSHQPEGSMGELVSLRLDALLQAAAIGGRGRGGAPKAAAAATGPLELVPDHRPLHAAAPQQAVASKEKEKKTISKGSNPRPVQLGVLVASERVLEKQQRPLVLESITDAAAAVATKASRGGPAGSGSAPVSRTAPVRTSSAASAPPVALPSSALSPGLSKPPEGRPDADVSSDLSAVAAETSKAAAAAVATRKGTMVASSSVSAAVAAAVAAAWPGSDAVSRVRRRAAELLAAVTEAETDRGGAGEPYTMMMTRMGQLLHASEAAALTEWRAAATKAAGSTKLGNLLNECTMTRTAAAAALPDATAAGGGGGVTERRRAYLIVACGVVQLDVEALLADAAENDREKRKYGGGGGGGASESTASPGSPPPPSSLALQEEGSCAPCEPIILEAAADTAAVTSVAAPAGTASCSAKGDGGDSNGGSGDVIADAALRMAASTALGGSNSIVEVAAPAPAAKTADLGCTTTSDDGGTAVAAFAVVASSDDTTISGVANGSAAAALADGDAQQHTRRTTHPSSSPLLPHLPPPLAEGTPTPASLLPPPVVKTAVLTEPELETEPDVAQLHGGAASDVPAAAAAAAAAGPPAAAAADVNSPDALEAPVPPPPPPQQQQHDSVSEGLSTAAAATTPAAAAAAAAPLPSVLADAVAKAWPDSDMASRLRQLAAAALMEGAAGGGPLGPWSMLWAQMAARIHKDVPNAHQRLLAEFPPATFKNKKTAVRAVMDESSFPPLPPASATASEAPRGAFLRVVHNVYDYVVQLDLPALLSWAMERRLEALWGPSAAATAPSAAAVKRCIARLLAAAPPPYQLEFTRLGSYVRKLLDGHVVRGLQKICRQDPDIFAVSLQSKDHYVVRLVDEQLLALAAELKEAVTRRVADSGGSETTASSALVSASPSTAAATATATAIAAAASSASSPRPRSSYVQPCQSCQSEIEPTKSPLVPKSKAKSKAMPPPPPLPPPKVKAPPPQQQKPQQPPPVSEVLQEAPGREDVQQQQQQTTTTTTTTKRRRRQQQKQKQLQQGDAEGEGEGEGDGLLLQVRADEQPKLHLAQQQQQQQQQTVEISRLETAVDGGAVCGGGGAQQQQQQQQQGPQEEDPPAPTHVYPYVPVPIPVPYTDDDDDDEEGEPTPSTAAPFVPYPAAAAAAAPAAVPDRDAVRADITAAAESAVGWLLGYEHPSGGGPCAWAAAAIAGASVQAVVDPYGPEAGTMRDQCRTCTQVGLAVQACGGQPVLVAVYAPATVAWPAAAVYLVDCTACTALFGGLAIGKDMLRVLLTSLRGLLEDPEVTKVVHGCEQVRCLEAACGGAVTAPLVDTQILLCGISFMLGLPPVPPSPNPSGVDVPQNQHQRNQQHTLGSPNPTSPNNLLYGLQADLAVVHDYVSRLYDALKGIGLWSERPGLLEALVQRHYAGLRRSVLESRMREEGGSGGGPVSAVMAALWLPRPLGLAQVAVLASGVTALPEIWLAMVEEAVLWVAVHAPINEMHRLRSTEVTEAAAAAAAPPPSP